MEKNKTCQKALDELMSVINHFGVVSIHVNYAKKQLQELVDFQTPKKPKIEHGLTICTHCLKDVFEQDYPVDAEPNYCKNCGKELDWNETNDEY